MMAERSPRSGRDPRGKWDIVVVGAGPAGAVLALQTAREGARVLLVDRHRFPRDKVCGCCLSARTVARLERLSLGDAVARIGGPPLHRIRLGGWHRMVELPMPGGLSVSRRALDVALVEEAIGAGTRFLPGHSAAVGGIRNGARIVELRSSGSRRRIAASVVVDASGLGSCMVDESDPPRSRAGRIGCSAMVPGRADDYSPGTIYMAVGRAGYVGLVRLEEGGLNVAAALEPGSVRGIGLGAAVEAVLREAGFAPPVGLAAADWNGTRSLWQAPRRRAAERIFAVGDAAGYVEPFTGEGIGWAIHSSMLLAPISLRAAEEWSPRLASAWDTTYRAELERSQRVCRRVSWLLRRPFAARCALRILERRPGLSRPIIRRLHGPGFTEEGIAWP